MRALTLTKMLPRPARKYAALLVSDRVHRQLPGWNLPLLATRAVGGIEIGGTEKCALTVHRP
jgi:predicted ATP-dependent Lon-type protease